VDFNTLYAGYDIDVVTTRKALSNFSYVSPISRYVGENKNQKGQGKGIIILPMVAISTILVW
jgi:hypothetical protein